MRERGLGAGACPSSTSPPTATSPATPRSTSSPRRSSAPSSSAQSSSSESTSASRLPPSPPRAERADQLESAHHQSRREHPAAARRHLGALHRPNAIAERTTFSSCRGHPPAAPSQSANRSRSLEGARQAGQIQASAGARSSLAPLLHPSQSSSLDMRSRCSSEAAVRSCGAAGYRSRRGSRRPAISATDGSL